MPTPDELLDRNVRWAEGMLEANPEFFRQLSKLQAPNYLWIGCADSRVPANQIIGLAPGELFVHRNIANVVVHTDLNCLSVMQYAVDILKVEHIIVCGHYGCGGIDGALGEADLGLVENWLRHVQDVQNKHRALLDPIEDHELLRNRLCELNVIEQVKNVCRTTIVRDAWRRNQPLSVHGWIYGLSDGRLRNLELGISSKEAIEKTYLTSIASLDR